MESNEELFSLKWYKEDTEFYRHTPQDPLSQPPPMNTYNGRQKPSQFEMNSRRRKPVSAYRPHNSGLIQTWPVSGIKIDVSFLIYHTTLKMVTFTVNLFKLTVLDECSQFIEFSSMSRTITDCKRPALRTVRNISWILYFSGYLRI